MHLSELLYQDESDSLDFKEEQYRFVGASEHEKAELLKDILAFANSWRKVDGYILIGVEEVKGGKSIVHGVSDHLDDANLQEFVNKKTNRHIDFSYRTEQLEGKSIGVIRLPVQKRPFFIKKDFGGVKAGAVKIRKGSSTFDAEPDEVFTMGEAYQRTGIPRVAVEFATEQKEGAGARVEFDCIAVSVPDEDSISDFESSDPFNLRLSRNRDYYRDVVRYHRMSCLLRRFSLRIRNTGDVQIDSLNVQLDFTESECLFLQECEPDEPSTEYMPNLSGVFAGREDDPSIERVEGAWRASFPVGSLQPKADFWTDPLYIGCTSDAEVTVSVKAYGKQFADPAISELVFAFSVTNEQEDSGTIIVRHLEERNG